MASKPKSMDTIRMVLKLAEAGCKIKEIERRTGISRNTIRKYLRLLSGHKSKELSAESLSRLLIESDTTNNKGRRYNALVVHFKNASGDLKKTGVTRHLLWLEYKEQEPDGYSYSQYCDHLKRFLDNADVVMHLEHQPGHETMIDFAGDKLSYIDRDTGEVVPCPVFVATLPFSGLTYCIAVPCQRTWEVVHCINQTAYYMGGMSKIVLGDNMRTLVTRTDRYDPVFTELCYQLGTYYGNVFQATRPGKPRDKAMVENHVKIVYQQVFAPLRKQTFYSLEALNAAILERVDFLNRKPYKGTSASRMSIFLEQEKQHMLALPAQEFVMKKKVVLTVQRNYHVQLSEDHHYYSVPYQYVGQKVDVLYDSRCVEIYLKNERIAVHTRMGQHRAYHTIADHMPSSHQHVQQERGFTQADFLLKAEKIGPCTLEAIRCVLESSFYCEQNYKSCNGVLMLAKKYGTDRLEAACNRVLKGSRVNYTLIRNILEKSMDKLQEEEVPHATLFHENLRGANHYQ